ncbi:MAG TPA: glycine--tRNA ligase subunit beta [Rhizomicrobium sp.]|nr:glycine--tRNA ligase subunit beta [Rhizomicrobium sp.]
MPDLLLELFSEEIPARMQAGAARDLERLMVGALTDRGYLFEGIKAFAGPRRLTLAIVGLPAKQNDVREELKGPKSDAPQAALDGFLKKTGLTKDQLRVEKTPKGDVYMAVVERKGRETPHVLAEIIPDVMAKLPWPKSMRWKPGLAVRWVRPLHSILCTFDGELVPFSFAGISSGLHTRGHRFLSEGTIEAKRFDDYAQKLKAAHVVLEAEERAAIIFEGVKQAAFVHGLEMIPDEGLLAEVSGLAEWPVIYVGTIQDEFMDVPENVLRLSMRTHQKYFSLRDPKTGEMANRFALVANMIAKDGGKEIVAGNERVLRARLSDAKFFWDEDRKRSLESRVEKLKGIVFHAKLGTQFERVMRIEKLAGEIAPKFGANVKEAQRAARLSKADLTTGVVGEFPELQGLMGGFYAEHDNEPDNVVIAISEHYGPLGRDKASENAVSNTVAFADKWDTVSGFFGIGEKPTGSGDPFAIRRAALGIIRIVLDRQCRISLSSLPGYTEEILSFFVDRLKVAMKDSGQISHDLIDATFSLGSESDFVRLAKRVDALRDILATEDGRNLLAGYKRAVNILKLEEKKDGKTFISEVSEKLLTEQAEKSLFAALTKARAAITAALAKEDFVAAMQQMAALRVPVDSFFEGVKVNADDKQVRENRLSLLASLRATLHQVADFSKIEG